LPPKSLKNTLNFLLDYLFAPFYCQEEASGKEDSGLTSWDFDRRDALVYETKCATNQQPNPKEEFDYGFKHHSPARANLQVHPTMAARPTIYKALTLH
jgi:hypothetical protein